MTQTNNSAIQAIHPTPLLTRMLTGAAIGLALISFFLVSAGEGNPAWGNFWMIKPLVMVPLAGAGAGLINYQLDGLRSQGGWKKALAIAATLIVYFIALWLGSVLGLNGTYWN